MELHSSLPAPQPPSWQDAPRLGLAQCWLPASLHALILACFARLFGRLEQLLHLWQTAGFPPPAVRAPSDIPAPRSTTGHRAPAAHISRHSSARSNARPSVRAEHLALPDYKAAVTAASETQTREGTQLALMLALAFGAFLRFSEMRALRWQDLVVRPDRLGVLVRR